MDQGWPRSTQPKHYMCSVRKQRKKSDNNTWRQLWSNMHFSWNKNKIGLEHHSCTNMPLTNTRYRTIKISRQETPIQRHTTYSTGKGAEGVIFASPAGVLVLVSVAGSSGETREDVVFATSTLAHLSSIWRRTTSAVRVTRCRCVVVPKNTTSNIMYSGVHNTCKYVITFHED